MATHLPRLPILLFVILAVHVPVSHGDDPALLPGTYDDSMCYSSMCGSVNITYPFYLASARKETTDYNGTYSYGYTDLEISCEEEGRTGTPMLVIQLGGDKYTVLNIFYNSSTIVLADSDVLGGPAPCPEPRHNVTFDYKWLQYNTSNYDYENLTFFSGCFSKPGDSMPPDFTLENYQINCSGPRGGPASFVFTDEELGIAHDYELSLHCDENVTAVPVLRKALMEYEPYMLAKGEYDDVLKKGFGLEWNRVTEETDQCYLCEGSGGRCAYGQSKAFLGCLCSGRKVGNRDCKRMRDHKRTTMYIVASASCLLFLCLAFFLTCKYCPLPFKSKDKHKPRIESFLQKNGNIHPKRYNYADVKRMTRSFAVKLGQGGFGAVYRGSLSDGRQVAVKMLKGTKGDGEEFMNEVASISRTSHVNIVMLLGFCLQGSKRALIYEYMPNGSLERYAFNNNMNSKNILSWEKLFDIAIGIARGLEYLHRGCNTRIVHFDIKPHNILLDQNFCPKISDFGLAKLCLNNESTISIGGARGTIGYIAPEVYSKQFGTVSSKSDVYSYGMMVLEMVGARDNKNNNADSESSSQYFPQWIYEHLDDYCISASEINGETTELVRKMIVVGLWCIQVISTNRPSMTRVVEMLEGSTSNLELPPKVLLS
ncbi:unnamed protein product [Urochloa decumbens]|uniref:Protein kinase domain-containing protein n=1 Tax=Urochloa decumbens TaxID=240449 RepID=A0ABC8Z7G1_9POAL